MLRMIAVVVLGGALFAGVAYWTGLFHWTDPGKGRQEDTTSSKDFGDLLYAAEPDRKIEPIRDRRDADPILVQGQLNVYDKIDVSSPIDGELAYVGEEIPLGAQLVGGIAPFLPDPCYVTKEKFKISQDKGIVEQETVIVYRRHLKGDVVERDRMLAFLRPVKAEAEKRSKFADVEVAIADHRSALKKSETYEAAYKRLRALEDQRPKTVALQDLEFNLATWLTAKYDAEAKKAAIDKARANLSQALLYLGQHCVLNRISTPTAIIKEIAFDPGKAVKPGDTIMELQSTDRFNAEGALEIQYYSKVKAGMRVTIEPSHEEAPMGLPRQRHTKVVNSVAFTNHKVPLIASASEDHSILLWDREFSDSLRTLKFGDAVRVITCSPQGASHNVILAGCADGSIYAWDLEDSNQKLPRRITAEHQMQGETVTSLAISPDGNFFASGHENASIKIWSLQNIVKRLKVNGAELDKELLYPLDAEHGAANAHYGPISSLHFTKQCRLVSAGRDNRLCVWKLKKKGVEPVGFPIPDRKGDVTQLGVSSDGRFMLFDLGKKLQIRAVEDGRVINSLQTPGNIVDFQVTSIFSPDGNLILTAGLPEGRLQLWSTPGLDGRGFEVRQFVTEERSMVTCAAFAPSDPTNPNGHSLAVSGTKDGNVYLWHIPSASEVRDHPIRDLTLTSVYQDVVKSMRHIQLSVDVRNPGRLIPGRSVTIVIQN
jgi:WD40 repeat protein